MALKSPKRSLVGKMATTSPHVIMAEACRRSFFQFVKEFWDVIITEAPVYNWHIEFLCQELEKLLWNVIARKPKPYDLVINIPPGSTKTTICSVMLPAWAWIARLPHGIDSQVEKRWAAKAAPGEDPRPKGHDLRFIAGSYAEKLSLENSSKSRDVIRSSKYKSYFPEIKLRLDKEAKSNFANTLHGSRFTTSVGAAVTGMHAHCILIDDPVDPQKALSDADRFTANDWIGNITTRSVRKDLTPLVLIMQRLHEDDPTATVLKTHDNVRHIQLPCDDHWEILPPELASNYVDGLLDPKRMSRSVLRDQERILGPYGYAGQFGQDPRPREGGLFQRDWFEIVDAAPPGGIEVRGWDLAASKKKLGSKGVGQAATSAVKLKIVGARIMNNKLAGGTIYILDDINFHGSADAVRQRLRTAAEKDGVRCIQDIPQDPGQAGKAQVQDLAALLHGYRIRYSVESGDKVVRADPLSAQSEAGNVKLVKGAWNKAWLDEMSIFPNGRKDRCDATVRAYRRAIKETQFNRSGKIGAPVGVESESIYEPIGEAYYL